MTENRQKDISSGNRQFPAAEAADLNEPPLSEEEISMVLDTFLYLNYQEAEDGDTINHILEKLAAHPDYGGGGKYAGEYTVLKEAAENQKIGQLIIGNQSHKMGYEATAACTFYDVQRETLYVAYRGTGDGEWPDNGLGLTQAVTPQQSQALRYFDQVAGGLKEKGGSAGEKGSAGEAKVSRLIVTGHSKGGNKAQFVTMESQYGYWIDACYSIDGQGFSEAAIDRWEKKYGQQGLEERKQKMYGIYGENDYVSVLGLPLIAQEHVRYLSTPVEKGNFAGYHDIKYMFASLEYDKQKESYTTVFHGRKNKDTARRGKLGNFADALSRRVMELEPAQRDGCAAVVMQLMEGMAGSKKGINGEKLSFEDVEDFLKAGVPLIGRSILGSAEGKELISALLSEPLLEDQVRGPEELMVNYHSLKTLAERLAAASRALEDKAGELEYWAGELGMILRTHEFYCSGIRGAAQRLMEIGRKMERRALLQRELAAAYENWDMRLERTFL